MKRQLAAILYTDAAGYSRMTGADEDATHEKLVAGLDLLTEKLVAHDGKKMHEAGNAILAEFASVTETVESALAFQRLARELYLRHPRPCRGQA